MQNKVYLNLEESIYKTNKSGLVFVFSSKLYMDKFIKLSNDYVKTETRKLSNKYKLVPMFDIFLLISLYKQIEKRGFYIYNEKSLDSITENIIFTENIVHY